MGMPRFIYFQIGPAKAKAGMSRGSKKSPQHRRSAQPDGEKCSSIRPLRRKYTPTSARLEKTNALRSQATKLESDISKSKVSMSSYSDGPPSPSSTVLVLDATMNNSSRSNGSISSHLGNVPTPRTRTGRISKAEKGKRVHACECGKVSSSERLHSFRHIIMLGYISLHLPLLLPITSRPRMSMPS